MDDFTELILSFMLVLGSRLRSSGLYLKSSHEPKLDAILFQMIIPKQRFFYHFAFAFVNIGVGFLGRKGV